MGIQIFSGPMPASADTAITQTLLATVQCGTSFMFNTHSTMFGGNNRMLIAAVKGAGRNWYHPKNLLSGWYDHTNEVWHVLFSDIGRESFNGPSPEAIKASLESKEIAAVCQVASVASVRKGGRL